MQKKLTLINCSIESLQGMCYIENLVMRNCKLLNTTSAFYFSSVLSYINLYAMELSLVRTASYFFMVYTVVILISRPITGRIVDRNGPNSIIYVAFIIFAIGLITLSLATDRYGNEYFISIPICFVIKRLKMRIANCFLIKFFCFFIV